MKRRTTPSDGTPWPEYDVTRCTSASENCRECGALTSQACDECDEPVCRICAEDGVDGEWLSPKCAGASW